MRGRAWLVLLGDGGLVTRFDDQEAERTRSRRSGSKPSITSAPDALRITSVGAVWLWEVSRSFIRALASRFITRSSKTISFASRKIFIISQAGQPDWVKRKILSGIGLCNS